MSPWVATTRPSLTPTMTPQPVPQKRHGAFDHWSWMSGTRREILCLRREGYIGGCCRGAGGLGFDEGAAGEVHGAQPSIRWFR